MWCVSDLTGTAFKESMKGFDATTLLLDGDYAEFVYTSLKIPFDAGIPPLQAEFITNFSSVLVSLLMKIMTSWRLSTPFA